MKITNKSSASDFYQFYAQCNLGLHIKYYNEHKRLIKNEIAWINQELEEDYLDQNTRIELEIRKQTYQSSYRDYMIINCFLMMYAHLEECLAVTFRLFTKEESETKGSGLDRFKKPFQTKYSIRISEAPQWLFLQDCSLLRHVLLHAAGNITLARDKKKIESIIKKNSHLVRISSSRIVLQEQLLNEFSSALVDFFGWVSPRIDNQHG